MHIQHSDLYTYHFTPIAHIFPSLTLYTQGATEAFLFSVPYDNVSDISYSFQPHIRSGKVLHQIGRMTCDSHHNFAIIYGIDCVTNCLKFCTIWEGVCIDLFSILYFV